MIGFINFETKHAVAGSSRLHATEAGHIYDIKVTKNLDNGVVVTLGAYVAPDIYNEAAPTSSFAGKIIRKMANGNYLVHVTAVAGEYLILTTPETQGYDYTSQMRQESNFYNAQGEIARAYQLHVDDEFELSAEGFTSTPTVGKAVSANTTSYKLVVASE